MARARRDFGTVRRLPSGRWQVRYQTRPASAHAPRTFASKTDATRYLAQVEADLLRGAWTDPRLARITFAEWAERWEADHGRPAAEDPATYRYLLRRLLLPTFGPMPLAGSTRWPSGPGWPRWNALRGQPSTVPRPTGSCRRILGAAIEAGYLPRNPCTIKGPGRSGRRRCAIAAVAAGRTPWPRPSRRYRALVLVAAYGGLRWGELVGLRVRRVDLPPPGSLWPSSWPRSAGQFTSRRPRRPPANARSPCRPVAAAALAEHLTVRRGRPGWAGVPARAGRTYLRRSNFTAGCGSRPPEPLGVEGLRFHDLRHTAATLAVAAGATTQELMERMGHTSPAVRCATSTSWPAGRPPSPLRWTALWIVRRRTSERYERLAGLLPEFAMKLIPEPDSKEQVQQRSSGSLAGGWRPGMPGQGKR